MCLTWIRRCSATDLRNEGVIGATTGIIGVIQAMEAIKLLAGIEEGLRGLLLVCDFLTMSFQLVKLEKNPQCPVCGKGIEKPHMEYRGRLVWLCGSNTVNINPPRPMEIDLLEAYRSLRRRFNVLAKSSLTLTIAWKNGVEATLSRSGRMLLRNVKDAETAVEVYNQVLKYLAQVHLHN